MNTKKPKAKLVGTDGNIFHLLSVAFRALKESGQEQKAVAMVKETAECENYNQALDVIGKYVEIE
ncbi:hypothetical protein J2Z48_002093 [Croceifilum oryzae]|uniref:Uncharacterized protein n=1 Tax=Croceifilum oryzae TaxID=1553429 RepID=A0AAJ1TG70_9BACL|nr:hypothetical protein [Croceifilum oryzae]MDQ0417909.1 hypothetical protein [Croceifilum oryzae]